MAIAGDWYEMRDGAERRLSTRAICRYPFREELRSSLSSAALNRTGEVIAVTVAIRRNWQPHQGPRGHGRGHAIDAGRRWTHGGRRREALNIK